MKKRIRSFLLVLISLFLVSSVCYAGGKRYYFKDIRNLYSEVHTKRLTLTPETREDIDILAEYLLDKDVTRFLDDNLEEGFDDVEDAKAYLMKNGDFDDPNDLTYTIKLANGVPIGELEFMYNRREKQAAVAYWIGKEYWNQKYISEVSLLLSNVVINAIDVDEICILYFYENKSSARISDKIFQYLIEQNKNVRFEEYKEDYPEIRTKGHILHKYICTDPYFGDDEFSSSDDSEDSDSFSFSKKV